MDDLIPTGLTQTEFIAVIVGVVLIVSLLAVAIVLARSARERRARLSERFGPEYDRTVEAASKRRDAEHDLQARLDRHADITVRPLEPGQAQAFEQRLDDLQARFVDAPAAAVVAADGVLADIAVAMGYPDGPTDQLLGDISVDHPVAVADHRRGQQVAQRSGKKTPSTEELRTALVASRHLCEALLAPSMATRSAAERHDEMRSEGDARETARVDTDRRDGPRSQDETVSPPPEQAPPVSPPTAPTGRWSTGSSAPPAPTAPTGRWSTGSSAPPAPTAPTAPTEPTRSPAGPDGRDPGADQPAPTAGDDDEVIELPEHEPVGQADRRSRSDGRPGEGLLGPDGRPVH